MLFYTPTRPVLLWTGALIPENWIVRKWGFRGNIPRLGGAEDDEDIEVLGRLEGVDFEARSGLNPGRGGLPSGWDKPGDLLQLERKYGGLLPTRIMRQKQVEDDGTLRKLVASPSRTWFGH